MNIVITGAAGFLGHQLALRLSTQGLGGKPVGRLSLTDRAAGEPHADPRVSWTVGDIADPDHVARLISQDVDVVFHLAAVVSGEAEADFDLGLRVNIDASRLVLEACRRCARPPRVVFTSSVAVFGPSAPGAVLPETASVDPRSSYGMAKAVSELLLKDYSRRGFVDGVVLRLPTISVRPGLPNKAASSFASGIIREPLAGLPAACPVPEDTRLWLLSPDRAIEALAHAATLDAAALEPGRVINLPGLSVTVAEMLGALEAVAGPSARGLVYSAPDAAVERIVASWPAAWDDGRARALGFAGDADFTDIVRAYVARQPARRATLRTV